MTIYKESRNYKETRRFPVKGCEKVEMSVNVYNSFLLIFFLQI